jgi:hypothetical protein
LSYYEDDRLGEPGDLYRYVWAQAFVDTTVGIPELSNQTFASVLQRMTTARTM